MSMKDARDLEIDRFLAQAESLAQLHAHPAWPAWTALLRDMRQAALEELARVHDPGEFRYWQGVAGALGEILDRPAKIVDAAAEHQRTEEVEKKVLRPELRAAIGLGVDVEGDV